MLVKWTAPADDGGSPITAYRVVILKTGTEIKNENITDPGTTNLSVGGLERDTEYSVKVFARNAVFEGPAGERTVRTKNEGKTKGCLILMIVTYYSSTIRTESSNKYQLQVLNETPFSAVSSVKQKLNESETS